MAPIGVTIVAGMNAAPLIFIYLRGTGRFPRYLATFYKSGHGLIGSKRSILKDLSFKRRDIRAVSQNPTSIFAERIAAGRKQLPKVIGWCNPSLCHQPIADKAILIEQVDRAIEVIGKAWNGNQLL